ncbi:hypothetical protein LCGC14_2755440, partial [marine sediment metagenome]
MNLQKTILAAVAVCVILAGCESSRDEEQSSSDSIATVVTEDIQRGIEKHIEEQSLLGEGYFRLAHDDSELKLKLVRVHTEYLANLGPRRHFACVDLASRDGDVYDVDFFLAGDAGAMAVTETTVHKVNGQRLYAWEQKRDKTWQRVPVKNAPDRVLGAIKGSDEFEFIYRATLPKMKDTGHMWIPMPTTSEFQTVEVKSVKAPGKREILQDLKYGNSILFLTLGPEDGGKKIELRFQVHRLEKGVYASEAPEPEPEQYLTPERLVAANGKFQSIAEEVVAGKKGDLVRARALYDHVIDRMRYMKFGSGWGKGDAVYACDARTGNCTDFHSYFIALSRS